MSISRGEVTDRLTPIFQTVARVAARHNLTEGMPGTSPATLRIVRQPGVRRVVQVYWTPFQVEIAGECAGLFLEVPKPLAYWTECYVAPTQRSWVLSFFERESDGDIQLAYYRDYEAPEEAIEGFFAIAGWYTLTARDLTWDDVRYVVAPDVPWGEASRETIVRTQTDPALQESLKKSSIVWLRWVDDGIERTMPVWYLYDQKAVKMFVISGERQQTLPGAERMQQCDVIFRRKGKDVRVGEVRARVRVLQPGPEWDEVAEKIAEKRLNIPGLPEDTARRWRDECHILELTLEF